MIKNILILGKGHTRQLLIQRALDRDYNVSAIVHSVVEIPIQHPNLELLHTDTLLYANFKTAAAGQDAILSVYEEKDINAGMISLTQHILRAMEEFQIDRWVSFSALNVNPLSSTMRLGYRLYLMLTGRTGRYDLFNAQCEQEKILQSSNINFVLVQAGTLTNNQSQINYNVIEQHRTSFLIRLKSISRNTVAGFLLDQLLSDTWLRKSIYIADETIFS